MIPKNSDIFCKRLKLLIVEVDEMLTDQALRKNFRELSVWKNTFRSKCLNFLSLSFDDPENSYKKEFEDNFPEVSQLHLSIFSSGSMPAPFSFLFENLQFTKELFTKYLEVTAFTNDIINDLPTQVTEEGLFFKGEYWEAIFHLDKIIAQASKEIKLVDNYINFDLITFLASRQNNVSIKIFTFSDQVTNLKLPLTSFQKQYSSSVVIKECKTYHDRFLVLDDSILYHFGASLKDVGSRTFMFSKINQPEIIQSFIADFESKWITAKVLFP